MFSISTVHTDDCTYTYDNLIAVIPGFSPENINKLSTFLNQSYQVNEDQLLELLNYQSYEYDGVVVEDLKGFNTHIIIREVKCL